MARGTYRRGPVPDSPCTQGGGHWVSPITGIRGARGEPEWAAIPFFRILQGTNPGIAGGGAGGD